MENREAIEILSRPFDMKNVPQDILEAHKIAISALEKPEWKKPIGIKVQGHNPYAEIANIIDDWCKKNYYESAFVTLSLNGRVITEYLSFNGNSVTGEFEWDMDWWEGERDVILLGFRMRSDAVFYGYPNSKENDEHDTD